MKPILLRMKRRLIDFFTAYYWVVLLKKSASDPRKAHHHSIFIHLEVMGSKVTVIEDRFHRQFLISPMTLTPYFRILSIKGSLNRKPYYLTILPESLGLFRRKMMALLDSLLSRHGYCRGSRTRALEQFLVGYPPYAHPTHENEVYVFPTFLMQV
ncbi:hypothetical protein EVAR_19486_1 [Eumeta japonica]|uniref:Uncharacterized protein n=1 Tax=Eumeta variegata TaxID=151549 RepID=A0A4C1VCC6_EUMVA|nr:hypothetical protein EVAR_19486_1 [Eumeta japonica]